MSTTCDEISSEVEDVFVTEGRAEGHRYRRCLRALQGLRKALVCWWPGLYKWVLVVSASAFVVSGHDTKAYQLAHGSWKRLRLLQQV